MPRSKRAKVMALTKTDKKDKGKKQHMIDEIRKAVDEYKHIYTFSVENMRNSKLKEVRMQWKDSRLFFGKNKVMAVALGRTASEEARPGLHKLTPYLKNQLGLLFTNREKAEVCQWFADYSELEYARSGNIAPETVTIEAGPLAFPHTMEPKLRELGLPVKLVKGVVTLMKDHTICQQGAVLDPKQTKLLEHFDKPLVSFHIILLTHFVDGKIEELAPPERMAQQLKPGPKRTAAQRPAEDQGEGDEEDGEDDDDEDEDGDQAADGDQAVDGEDLFD